jgi:hypothetical protein
MIFWVIFAYLRGYTIVYRFCVLKRVNQVQSVFHTQEGEPASRIFVTRYKGFPILNTTHMRRPSVLLYDFKGRVPISVAPPTKKRTTTHHSNNNNNGARQRKGEGRT